MALCEGMWHGTYPPGPLSYEERGSIACLMDENKGCFYGFEPAHHAIKTRQSPLAKPIRVPPSSQAQA